MTETERILSFMPVLLNPRKAKGKQISFAFRFSGPEGGEFTLAIDGAHCDLLQGVGSNPTTLIECRDTTWIAIAEKRLHPFRAMLNQELRVSGSKLAMLRFGGLFSGDPIADEVPAGLYAETENEAEVKAGVKKRVGRVLLIQASPRKKVGATETLAGELVAGLEESGAWVDTIYLSDKDIRQCTGCYTCWHKTEGVCVFNDDMAAILPTIPQYDLLVLATPLYTDAVPGKLKTFFDRCIPLAHPYIFNKSGRCRHPSRFPRLPNMALLSVCGFYETSNFDGLVRWCHDMAENGHMPLVAAMLRPHAHSLLGKTRFAALDSILAATRQAGRELATTGAVCQKTLAAISQPVVPRPIFMAAGKKWWELDV